MLSPILGWIGVAVTGSDTSANALFGALQVQTAAKAGLDPLLMAAANSSGGVLGKMVSPQNLAIAAAAVGMAGQRGRHLPQGHRLEPAAAGADVRDRRAAGHPGAELDDPLATCSARPVRRVYGSRAGSSGGARVSTASSMSVVLLDARLELAEPDREVALGVVAGEVDRGDDEQPLRADVLDVQVGDPVDLGQREQGARAPARAAPAVMPSPEQVLHVAAHQEHRDARQQHPDADRADGVAARVAGGLVQADPAAAMSRPSRAAASSKNTARSVGLEVRAT